MNRKFVKENKTLVKEFLGKLISSIIGAKTSSDFNKMMKQDKGFASDINKIRDLRKDLDKKLQNIKKKDPELYNQLKNKYS
jgi:uncharacterized protein YaaR (DUF327 family)